MSDGQRIEIETAVGRNGLTVRIREDRTRRAVAEFIVPGERVWDLVRGSVFVIGDARVPSLVDHSPTTEET